jgi:hypothetical protein
LEDDVQVEGVNRTPAGPGGPLAKAKEPLVGRCGNR